MNIQKSLASDTCPICHVGSLRDHYLASPLDYSAEQSFPISICTKCGHGKTRNVLQHKDGLYAGGCYDITEKAWHKFIQPLLSALELNKLRYLKTNKITGNRLLEIGCGKGRFLEAAKKRGFQVYGIEPSSRSFAFASNRLGNSVAAIALEDLDSVSAFPDEYDHVMLWHVLEHLNDPGAVLSQIRKTLADNGSIVIAVPNFASFQARLGKADWYHLDPPRHVHHFTPESLRTLAKGNGLDIEEMFFNSFYQNMVGDLITLVNKLLPGKNAVFNGLRLNAPFLDHFGMARAWAMFILAMALGALIALPTFIFTLFNQLIGQAGTMVVIMKSAESKLIR